MVSRPYRRRRPSTRDDGGVSGLFSSGGHSVRFLPRYDGEVSEPLVGRQGSRVSMRVARGSASYGKSALPQRGSALPSCFPLPFRYSKVLLRLRKHCPLAWKAERLRGSGQQKRGARAPETPGVRKGGQSEGPALVKFSASFPTSLGNAP